MAARFTTGQQTSVKFYNTDQNDVATLYHQAIADGNQIVIGPLSKQNVGQLLQVYDGSVPALTLNYSDTSYRKDSLL